jgi:hypothetical protein
MARNVAEVSTGARASSDTPGGAGAAAVAPTNPSPQEPSGELRSPTIRGTQPRRTRRERGRP